MYYTEEVPVLDEGGSGEVAHVSYHVSRSGEDTLDDDAISSLRRILETVTETEIDLPTLRAAVCRWIEVTPGVASPHRTVPHRDGVTVGYRVLDADDAWRFACVTISCPMLSQQKLLAKYADGYW